MQGLFITGTDTSVGKTFVTCAITRSCLAAGIRVGAYKPVCTGGETSASGKMSWSDAELLAAALDHRFPVDRICPQRFAAPLAPPSSAGLEGRRVDEAMLQAGVDAWADDADLLLIEGVGGLLCPLTDSRTVADLAADLGFPLVIVAALKLGAINHTLLTIEVAGRRGLPVAGLILNHVGPDDGSSASSITEITRRSPVPVLAILPFEAAGELRPPEAIRRIDWHSLAAKPTVD